MKHQAFSWSHPLPAPPCLRSSGVTVRGGGRALARVEGYEGIPPPYDKKKRMGVEASRQGHEYCLVWARLSSEVGWNHYDTIRELEEMRKERSQEKKQLNKLREKAEVTAEEKLGPQVDILAPVKNFEFQGSS
ncbi:60S ribosomal protein L13a-4 [Populus alba x Populus x berolinensis]|nr:60S ribosomal protein L13a-4 [Populus alba x Populus x berolinensis]